MRRLLLTVLAMFGQTRHCPGKSRLPLVASRPLAIQASIRQPVLILAVFLVARPGFAEKPAGTVAEVQGNHVKVQTDFDFLPSIGDRLEVIVDSSSGGATVVGTLVVEDLANNSIVAKIERGAGEIQKGQKIRAAVQSKTAEKPAGSTAPAAVTAADSLNGQVTDVQGTKVLIALDTGGTPKAGDRVEIFVEIEGVGRATVATASLTTVVGKSVLAEILEATGRVAIGQKARIIGAAPPATAESPTAWLGVYVREVYRDQATKAGLDHPFGVAVVGALDDSPASRQGLHVGDLLLTRDGQEIASTTTWSNDLESLRAGAVLHLEILRAGKRQSLDIKLEAAPDKAEIFRRVKTLADQGAAWAQNEVGLMLQNGEGVAEDRNQALDWFRRAGEGGDLIGLVRWAAAHEIARDVPRDCVVAARHFRQAADAGDPEGQAGLGGLYWRGDGVEQNDQESLKWNRLSAEQGCARGEFQLAVGYKTGRGVERRDPVAAAQWCLKAAIQGYRTAQLAIAERYEKGDGVPQDETQAQRWYREVAESARRSASGKDIRSKYLLATLHQRGKGVNQDYAEAARLFRVVAETGDAEAAFQLSLLYSEGRGVARDDQEAAKWVRAAVDNGDRNAMNRLGWLYENGRGVKQDYAESLRWYRTAAEKGSAVATSNVGLMYEKGQGVALDLGEAFRWQQRAAKLNGVEGQYHVGRMIAEGIGVQKDLKEGADWVRLAADQGYANAQNYLGWMYQNGHGMPANSEEATVWYKKAAAQGNQDAVERLKGLNLSDLSMLKGTWVCVVAARDGKDVDNWVGVRAVIDGDNLTWRYPNADGTYREQEVKFRIDPNKTPKHFDWWSADKPGSLDMRIYSLEGGVLRWGTNLDGKTRPESFEAARWQFTMRRIDRSQ